MHGIQVTKVFGREDHDLQRFSLKNAAVLAQQRSIFRSVSRFTPAVGFVGHLDTAILLLYGGYLVVAGALSLGELIVFAGLPSFRRSGSMAFRMNSIAVVYQPPSPFGSAAL
jgi:ATP-binding cassette subfamily B protein